jgi:uncharacterized protein
MTSDLWKRPILLGGLGLTAGAWLLHGLDPSVAHLGGTAVWSAIAVGSGFWWLKQFGKPTAVVEPVLQTIDRAKLEKAFQSVEAQIAQLEAEQVKDMAPAGESAVQALRQQLADLRQILARKTLQLTILGSEATGKTTVAPYLSDIPHLTVDDQAAIATSDLVLYVTTGDMTDTDFQTIQSLLHQQYRVLVAFNKQDQYLPADRPVILQQLRDRLQDWLAPEDVVGIMAKPAPLKVRQHQADGTIQERIEQPAPVVAVLQERLQQVVAAPETVVIGTCFRQVQALAALVQGELNQLRRNRALPIIEQYQWIAAAAAFANPVPSLDLLATATINAQMVVDLGGLYQQQFSLEQGKMVAGSLGSQMVKLGLVEMASQAISPLLKSHALTYVAGGTLQGLSAAYLTRLAGLSLVEFFEEQGNRPITESQLDGLVQKLKAVFQANQRTTFVQGLVKQGLARLAPAEPSPIQSAAS